MAGDPNALNALARQDPTAAMGIRAQQFDMDQARQQAQRATAEAARKLSADQLAQETAKAEQALAGAVPLYTRYKAGDAAAGQQLAQYLQGHGIQATPDNVDQLMFQSQTVVETLKAFQGMQPQPADPLKGAPSGFMFNQPGNPAAGVSQLPGYTPPGPQTVVNTGDNSGAFNKKADELAATRFDAIMTDGQNAQQMIGDLGALAELAKGLTTGMTSDWIASLGPYAESVGMDIKGLGPMQAYRAITSRMAPQMKVPGSGTSSDKDIALFLDALPTLGKTPDGNAIISATLQSVQQQKVAAAKIAGQAFNKEITWQEADKRIRALGNPFDAFSKFKGKGAQAGSDAGLSATDIATMSATDISKADIKDLIHMPDEQIGTLSAEQRAALMDRLTKYNTGQQ